jgi:hypothetical protein
MNQAQQSIKNKMDSILLSARRGNSDHIHKLCRSMDSMTIEEKRELIRQHWGQPALQKVEPLLIQYDSATGS